VLVEAAVSARHLATGHLLFARKGALFAVPFDLDRLEVQGTAVPVVEGIATDISDGRAGFAGSEDGTLAYLPAADFSVPDELLWVSRTGAVLGTVAPPGMYEHPVLSADGRWLALALTLPPAASDVVLLDLVRGTRTSLTSGSESDFGPLFTPSAERVIFVSERPIFDLYVRAADGSSPSSPLVVTKADKHPGSITPDGKTLLFTHTLQPHEQIWTTPLDGPGDPAALVELFLVRGASLDPPLALQPLPVHARFLSRRAWARRGPGERSCPWPVPSRRTPPAASTMGSLAGKGAPLPCS